jgi:small subunit ribosomal protein SAe
MNLPVVAFCDTDSNLSHVDIAIPCNNKGDKAIALMYWMLARQVLRMKNAIPAGPWSVMVDLFVYRNPEESKEEKSEENAVVQVEAPAAELVEEGAAAAAAVDSHNFWTHSYLIDTFRELAGVTSPRPVAGMSMLLRPNHMFGAKCLSFELNYYK